MVYWLITRRCSSDFQSVTPRHMLQINSMNIWCKITLMRIPQNTCDDKSILLQVDAVKQQTITWANADQNFRCYMAPLVNNLCIVVIIQITKIVALHEGGTPSCFLLWCNTVGSLRGENCYAWWWFVVRLCIDRRSGTALVSEVLTHCGLLTPYGVMERVDCSVLVKSTVWRCFGTKPLFEPVLIVN